LMHKKDYHMAPARDMREKSEEGVWDTVKVIIQALLIAFFVRTFFYQPFNIPSESMYPTLKVGDYLFVSKLSYGYSKYSFNFSFGGFGTTWIKCCPIDFPGRVVLADTPKRGDVAVFKLPTDTNIDYIKRVIGLPGDRIQMRDGVLFINGEAVPKVRVEDYVDNEPGAVDRGVPIEQFEETLPNGVKYRVLDRRPGSTGEVDNTDEYVVPAGHYFMMGDNRDNSEDSRFLNAVGYVPIENYVGRADIIFFSISRGTTLWEVWKWPFEIRWGRFLNLL
jgi:signal peptidase I